MSDFNNIEIQFQEKLENFEMPVRAELWNQVAAGAGIGKTVFWTTSKIVAAAFAGVLVVSAVSWFVLNGDADVENSSKVQFADEQTLDEKEHHPESVLVVTEENSEKKIRNQVDESFYQNIEAAIVAPGSREDYIRIPDPEMEDELPLEEEPIMYLVRDVDDQVEAFEDVAYVEQQSTDFEPAPVEILNLDILIAPEKTEERTLEQIHFPHDFIKIFNPSVTGEAGQFSIRSENLGSFKIEIRTRSGKLVYQSNDANFVWNGEQLDGSDAPQGTYMYTIFATTREGVLIKPSGSVFLMR